MGTDEVAVIVEKFFSKFPTRKYSKGQIMIFSGEVPSQVFYIIKGQVKQYDVSYRGDEVILNKFKSPAFFPMSLAINGGPNPYIFETVVETEVRLAPRDEVIKFLRQHPEVTYDLLSRVYRGVDGILGHMVQLMSGSAQSRLLYEIIIEGRRFGTFKADGTCLLNMRNKDLGSLTGISRETVNRELNKLKASGIVKIKNHQLIIDDMEVLQKKLGHEV